MKTLIQKALVIDGTGMTPFVSDVLIDDSKIAKIAFNLHSDTVDEVIEASGLVLSPGFINTHSHMELEALKNPALPLSIQQGITTEVLGQDGLSVAPVTHELILELENSMSSLSGRLKDSYPWRSFAEYMDTLNRAQPAVRFVSLVGHGTLRMNVMGYSNRHATTEETEAMCVLLDQCLRQGAKGMSMGLIYPPGSFCNTAVLLSLARIVKKHDGIIMVHMRDEKSKIIESVHEMIGIVKQSGVRLQISHFKSLGQKNWGKVREALSLIEEVSAEGYSVTFDQYPWNAASTGLNVCCPSWAFEGGSNEFYRRLDDLFEYERIYIATKAEIELRGGGGAIQIGTVTSEKNSWMTGQSVDIIAQHLGKNETETVLEILKDEGQDVVATYFSISEEDVAYLMKSPLHGVCTDGIIAKHPHPRIAGSFPRFLGHYVRDLKLMSWETAIMKITGEPARRLRLWDRGLIREGLSADLVLFDPKIITEKNDYLNPLKPPEGINFVWVLGKKIK